MKLDIQPIHDNDLVNVKYLKDNKIISDGGGTHPLISEINNHVYYFDKVTDNANYLPQGWSLVGSRVKNLPQQAWFWVFTKNFNNSDYIQFAFGKDDISLSYRRSKSHGVWAPWITN